MVYVLAAVMALVGQVMFPDLSVWFLYTNPAYRIWEFVVGIMLATLLRRGFRVPVSLRAATP